MKNTKILIAVLALALVVGIAAAAYVMTAPMSDDITVNPPGTQATLSKVTSSTYTLTEGASITLSTTVSDGTQGINVTFLNQNGVSVGTAVTDNTGTASVTITPPEGTWSFYATATHP